MRRLNGQDIVQIWEKGRGQSGLHRALVILEQAFSDCPRESVARLPIGQRDEWLFAVRTLTFGRRIPTLIACPLCGEQLEFEFEAAEVGVFVDSLSSPQSNEDTAITLTLQDHPYMVEYRLLNSIDLAACDASGGVEAVRNALIRRCIVQASMDGIEVMANELPDGVIESLAKQVSDADPHALIEFDLNCPTCTAHWQSTFDIASYLWTEIDAQAKRLLREVHSLASAYGWSETDILALSDARRQFYLEMVT